MLFRSDSLDELLDTTGVSWDRGMRTAAAIGDINHNGQAEMIVGNYSGGLEYFNGNAEVSPGITKHHTNINPLYIFPNPVKDRAVLSFNSDNQNVHLSIFTVEGNLVLSKTIQLNVAGRYRLNITWLPNGLYVVKITTPSAVYTGKMAVVR